MEGKFDVAVIGGGLTGLTASILMAKAGLSVVLLEKSDKLGGRSGSIKKNKAIFNLGLHAYYTEGAGDEVLRELGISLEGSHPKPKVAVVDQNRVLPLPAGGLSLMTSTLMSWSGKIEFIKLMLKLRKMNLEKLTGVSLQDWVDREVEDPMVRRIVISTCRANSYIPYPELQSAGPALAQLKRTMGVKAFYVDGGWESIVNKLAEEAVRSGVTIYPNKNVSEISHNGGVRHILFIDGDKLDISTVLVAAGPSEACRIIPNARNHTLGRWKTQARPLYAACLDLALTRLPQPNPFFVVSFWLDQPLFYSYQSSAAKLSVDGSDVVSLVKFLGTEPGDPKEDEMQLEQAMDVMQPGWRKEVVARQFLPSMLVVHDFHAADRPDRFTGPSIPEIDGLYVAGDWAGQSSEMLVDAAFASAKRAAVEIVNKIGR